MGSLGEIMKLCRLCLVKDQVNVPIFEGAGDIRKISQKIGACLPVKVTKDDKLPKKICNGCSHKLDMVYQFWNTTTSSEKQLLEWVNNPSSRPLEERGVVAEHIVLKQEVDNGDSEALDAGEFIDVNETFETIGFAHDDDDEMSNENIDIKTENDSRCDEPPIKKHKTVSLSSAESEEDADDPSDAYNRDDSDEDDNDVSEAQPAFVNVAEADQQPGPSGVGKASGEAPLLTDFPENPSTIPISVLQYPCDICSKLCPSTRALKKHSRIHDHLYTCESCGKSFRRLVDYTTHLKKHTYDLEFKCLFCEYKTEDIKEISEHVLNGHEEKYKCSTCEKQFILQNWLVEHQNYHSGEKPFVCDLCKKAFMYSSHLRCHEYNFHNVELRKASVHECVICQKQYRHKNSLNYHMNTHYGQGAICDICGKKLSSKDKLKFHLRIHTGYKPYKCSFCEKAFTKKSMKNEHERTHTGEKPYSCKYCDKNFTQRSSMVIHVRGMHTDERPFSCHICEKSFVAKSMLNFHLKSCKGFK